MVVITQSIGTGSGRSSDRRAGSAAYLGKRGRESADQFIGEVDAQDGRSAVGDRPLVSEQWTSVPIRSRAASVDAPRCRRHLFAALRVEQGDPGGLERHYPAQRLQHRGGRSSMLADPAAILDRDL